MCAPCADTTQVSGIRPSAEIKREHPERHGTQAEEVARHVLRESWNQEDHEAEDGALRLDDEPQLPPNVRTHEPLNVASAKPPSHGERRHRPERQPDRRVEQSAPLAKQVATENPRQPPWNRRDDDLQNLKTNEDDRRQDAPISRSVCLRNRLST